MEENCDKKAACSLSLYGCIFERLESLVGHACFFVLYWIILGCMPIPNLLTNYAMKLHEIKTMCTNITPEHIVHITPEHIFHITPEHTFHITPEHIVHIVLYNYI